MRDPDGVDFPANLGLPENRIVTGLGDYYIRKIDLLVSTLWCHSLRIPAPVGCGNERRGAMRLRVSLFLMVAAFSFVELTSPARLCGQGQSHKIIDLGIPRLSASDGASAGANAVASDFPYVIQNVSIGRRIEVIQPLGLNESISGRPASLQCTPLGHPCVPHSSSCCSNLRCVFFGGSTRTGYQCR